MATTVTLTPEEFQALADYKAQHGRKWKDRLTQAWLNDWREQWGILRTIRNARPMVETFKAFDLQQKAADIRDAAVKCLPRHVAQALITKLDLHAISVREAKDYALQYYGQKLVGRTREQVAKAIGQAIRGTQP